MKQKFLISMIFSITVFFASTASAETFEWQEVFSPFTPPAEGFSMADAESILRIDSQGFPHLVWLQKQSDSAEKDVYYSFWNGSSWQALDSNYNVSRTPDSASYRPRFKLDSNDKAHIAWEQAISGADREIYYVRWTGTDWNAYGDINVSMTVNDSQEAWLDLNESLPVICWDEDIIDDIFCKYWDGSAWSVYGDLNVSKTFQGTNSIESSFPRINVEDSTVHLTWADKNYTQNHDAFYMYWNGSSWNNVDGNSHIPFNSDFNASSAGILADPRNDNVYIAWEARNDADDYRFLDFTYWNGSSWNVFDSNATIFEYGWLGIISDLLFYDATDNKVVMAYAYGSLSPSVQIKVAVKEITANSIETITEDSEFNSDFGSFSPGSIYKAVGDVATATSFTIYKWALRAATGGAVPEQDLTVLQAEIFSKEGKKTQTFNLNEEILIKTKIRRSLIQNLENQLEVAVIDLETGKVLASNFLPKEIVNEDKYSKEFDLDLVTSFSQPGLKRLAVRVDPFNLIREEKGETNNDLITAVLIRDFEEKKIPELADLAFTETEFDKSKLFSEELTIKAKIKNIGEQASPQVSVSLHKESPLTAPLQEKELPVLLPGEETEIEFNLATSELGEGMALIYLEIDKDNELKESLEFNNRELITVNIQLRELILILSNAVARTGETVCVSLKDLEGNSLADEAILVIPSIEANLNSFNLKTNEAGKACFQAEKAGTYSLRTAKQGFKVKTEELKVIEVKEKIIEAEKPAPNFLTQIIQFILRLFGLN